MKENKTTINRRHFLQSTAFTAGAFAIAPLQTACTSTCEKEVNRSNFGGVKIGVITYSFRSLPTDAGNVLLYSLVSGLGTYEIPKGSNAVKETAKCVEWTQNVLVK